MIGDLYKIAGIRKMKKKTAIQSKKQYNYQRV